MRYHDSNGHCYVVAVAIAAFGQREGMMILWEETCYPFSDEEALRQLKAIIELRKSSPVVESEGQ